jgi:hypothetical protein
MVFSSLRLLASFIVPSCGRAHGTGVQGGFRREIAGGGAALQWLLRRAAFR